MIMTVDGSILPSQDLLADKIPHMGISTPTGNTPHPLGVPEVLNVSAQL